LAPIKIALDLDHYDTRVTVERNDVRPASSQERRLALDEE
jgi:hypothetical protein